MTDRMLARLGLCCAVRNCRKAEACVFCLLAEIGIFVSLSSQWEDCIVFVSMSVAFSARLTLLRKSDWFGLPELSGWAQSASITLLQLPS